MAHNLDAVDRQILTALQDQGRLTNVELADRVGLTPAPCLRRVRALEDAGIIQKYAALVNQHALSLGVTVFAQVTLDKQIKQQLEMTKIEEVKESDYVIVLDPPEAPLKRSKPKKRRSVIIAGVFGIILGISFGFIIEYLSSINDEERQKIDQLKSLFKFKMT